MPNGIYSMVYEKLQNASAVVLPTPTGLDAPVLSVTDADVRSVCLRVNPRKVTGPDAVPSCALRSCADQLTEVFTDVFNLSMLRSEVPNCSKKTTIIPEPKKIQTMCLYVRLPPLGSVLHNPEVFQE
eukprot:g43396.t1